MDFDDDDENGNGSNNSDNENEDEVMDDVDDGDNADGDGDGDGDDDADADGDDGDDDDGDNDDDEGDGEGDNDDDDQDEADSPSQRPQVNGGTGASRTSTNPTVMLTSPSPGAAALSTGGGLPFRPTLRPEVLTAAAYDIVPTIAAPHSTSINSITATPDMRWVFSGGADGYIRKFNWVDTVNGKLALTVNQRHPFVDSVTKAGVLLSYWENEDSSDRNGLDDGTNLSPVYSLAVHHQSLWLLSGTESGAINFQSVRHEEGKRITTLRQHTSAVSVLTLSQDEQSVLSGSWDTTINDWDLNTGLVKRKFETSGSQISAIEQRPLSTLPIPQDTVTMPLANGTFSSNNASKPLSNGVLSNGVSSSMRSAQARDDPGNEDAPGSPDDSLFGDNASLFGDDKDPSNGPSALAPFVDDEEDEFSRAIANGIKADEEAQADMDMMDVGGPVQAPESEVRPGNGNDAPAAESEAVANGTTAGQSATSQNGLPHSEDIITASAAGTAGQSEQPASSESTFMDASIDGTIRIWDRRQANPIARIVPPSGTPPWCMNTCWSPDGNFIYAGRRNGTVDEYSLHKSLREPRRTFRFPGVSGAVSAVRAMPNGKHLICASYDILRLYDLREQEGPKHSAVPYLIVPGHRTGVISQLYIDPTCSFMISTGGNRGWEGANTEVLLGYEIGIGT